MGRNKIHRGYTGQYVVIARKQADKWYVGGVSNLDKSVELELNLPMFEKGEQLSMINDNREGDPVKTQLSVKDPHKIKVKLNPNSGFVNWN